MSNKICLFEIVGLFSMNMQLITYFSHFPDENVTQNVALWLSQPQKIHIFPHKLDTFVRQMKSKGNANLNALNSTQHKQQLPLKHAIILILTVPIRVFFFAFDNLPSTKRRCVEYYYFPLTYVSIVE